MALPQISIIGGITAEPELRHTGAGKAVLGMRVGASERRKNPQTQEWEDGEKFYANVSLWEEEALAAADYYRKGDQVVVTGQLFQRDYEKSDGSKGQSIEVKFAKVAKQAPRQNSGQSAPAQSGGWPTSQPAPTSDPWSTHPASGAAPF